MKKIITILLLSILCMSAVPEDVKILQVVTSAGTSDVEMTITNLRDPSDFQRVYVYMNATNTGWIKFSVGEACSGTSGTWAAGTSFPITIRNDKTNGKLHYQTEVIGDKFIIVQ